MAHALRLSPDLTFPLTAITETFAIFGKRGSGKTNTAAVYVEELLSKGQQVVVIDPTDVWWGLKSSADGTKAGFPVVIAGGRHGDVPLSEDAGAGLADFIVTSGASVVCSLRHFESHASGRRFLTDLLTRLYYLKGQQDHPTPIAVVLDEASLFAPQRVMGEDAKCLGAIQKVIRQGRSSGFGVTLIDQRPGSVNTEVRSQMEVLIVHRVVSVHDRKALKEWVEQHDEEDRGKQFLASLATLKDGDAWVWSAGTYDLFMPTHMRLRTTYDSSVTPKPGVNIVAPKVLAEIDLKALTASLAASIEKAKADDPKELRKEIARLERELTAKETSDSRTIDARWQAVIDENDARWHAAIDEAVFDAVNAARDLWKRDLRRVIDVDALTVHTKINQLSAEIDVLVEKRSSARVAYDALETLLRGLAESSNANVPESAPVRGRRDTGNAGSTPASATSIPRSIPRSIPAPRTRPIVAASDGKVSGVGQRILDTLAGLTELGVAEPDKATLAALVGYHMNAKSYSNALGALRTGGHIVYPSGGRVAITESGHAIATPGIPVRSRAELHQLWFERLGNVAQRILEPVLRAYPDALDASTVAAAADYHPNAKSFSNMKGRLRTLKLIDYPAPGQIVATAVLFPKGLR